MSRLIKFRAWDGEAMYYSDDIGNDFDFEMTKEGFILMLNEQFHECGSGVAEEYWNYVEKTGAAFMQFTGLEDCNGVEVYEGDILDHHGFKVTVKWHDEYGKYYLGGKSGGLGKFKAGRCKVIGNIHEITP